MASRTVYNNRRNFDFKVKKTKKGTKVRGVMNLMLRPQGVTKDEAFDRLGTDHRLWGDMMNGIRDKGYIIATIPTGKDKQMRYKITGRQRLGLRGGTRHFTFNREA